MPLEESFGQKNILFAKGTNKGKSFQTCHKCKSLLQTTLVVKFMSVPSLHTGHQNAKHSFQNELVQP